jgi:hypothetical protein
MSAVVKEHSSCVQLQRQAANDATVHATVAWTGPVTNTEHRMRSAGSGVSFGIRFSLLRVGLAVSNSDFGPKLDLVLKALSMSRGRLAAELRVDKSLVGRWVAGTVTPSAHNLAALTTYVANKRTGFTMLDWDRDLTSFSQALGVELATVKPDRDCADSPADSISLPPALVEISRRETEHRGKFYEGFYETTFASTTRPGWFVREMAMITRRNNLLYMRMGGPSVESSGWAFLISSQLYAVLTTAPNNSFVFLILNGLPMRNIETMDGLFMDNVADVSVAPAATPIYFEFVEELSENEEADGSRFSALRNEGRYLATHEIPEALQTHLLPNVGPIALDSKTGDLLMRMPTFRSLSRGVDFRGRKT